MYIRGNNFHRAHKEYTLKQDRESGGRSWEERSKTKVPMHTYEEMLKNSQSNQLANNFLMNLFVFFFEGLKHLRNGVPSVLNSEINTWNITYISSF